MKNIIQVLHQYFGIYLDETALNLQPGGNANLQASNETKNILRWTSSNPAAAAVDQEGNITAKAVGTAVITVSAGEELAVTGYLNLETKQAVIPQTVTIFGKQYTVTQIAERAFYKNTKITSVVIPSTIKKIGKQAFSGCKKLKKITVKTTKLTKKNVGAKALKGICAKASIKVPGKKLKAYQKLFKSKGTGRKDKYVCLKQGIRFSPALKPASPITVFRHTTP